MRAALLPVTVVALLCSAETCGPSTSILPAYSPATVVADDALVGSYVLHEEGEPSGRATITREDTVDGPSYVIDLKPRTGTQGALRARLFRFDLEGVRLADVVLLAATAPGTRDAPPLPQHLVARVKSDADGVDLEFLALDRAQAPTLDVPLRYWREGGEARVESARVLAVTDQAALLAVLRGALRADAAWSLRLGLRRPTAPPPLVFTLVDEHGERSRDMSLSRVTWTVRDDRVLQTTEHRGRVQGLPGLEGGTRAWRLGDEAALRPLLEAARSARRATPRQKVPPTDTRYTRLCLAIGRGEPRCVERLPDDDSGADHQALRALADALARQATAPALAPATPPEHPLR